MLLLKMIGGCADEQAFVHTARWIDAKGLAPEGNELIAGKVAATVRSISTGTVGFHFGFGGKSPDGLVPVIGDVAGRATTTGARCD